MLTPFYDKSVLFEEIRAFLLAYAPYDPSEITYLTTLEGDLGISGLDADEFMYEFFKRFDIDYTGFELSKYFGPEGFSRKTTIYDLLVEDLIEATYQKKWIDPVV